MPSKLSNAYYTGLAAVTVWGGAVTRALAQNSVTDVNEFMKAARTAAQSSNISQTGITNLTNTGSYMLASVMGLTGFTLASISGHAFYKAVKEENGRESAGRSLASAVVGALITVMGLLVGAVTYWVTN